jgi:glucose/arabinose dehydrogenase
MAYLRLRCCHTLGIALDPNFADNRHIFMYYSPSNTAAPYFNRVSRFTIRGNDLDMGSEKIVLRVRMIGQKGRQCNAMRMWRLRARVQRMTHTKRYPPSLSIVFLGAFSPIGN